MVINLDRSINRLNKMRAAFEAKGLPLFERVAGVLVTADRDYQPPRLTKSLKLADYGCALAHREAWKRVVAGPHEWVVILEDDAVLVDTVNLTVLPKVSWLYTPPLSLPLLFSLLLPLLFFLSTN